MASCSVANGTLSLTGQEGDHLTQVVQLCNQELQNLNFSPHISITIKANGWDGHVACTEEQNNACDASVKNAVGSDLKETQFWVGDYYKAL